VCVRVCCGDHSATCCNMLQHSATHCDMHIGEVLTARAIPGGGCDQRLQHNATICNTLQHAATHCNMLQHPRSSECHWWSHFWRRLRDICCKTLQRIVQYCNTLQHTATHCNMPVGEELAAGALSDGGCGKCSVRHCNIP